MDTQKLRELLDKRDAIDDEIRALVTGSPRKTLKCGKCGAEGHNSRGCTQQ